MFSSCDRELAGRTLPHRFPLLYSALQTPAPTAAPGALRGRAPGQRFPPRFSWAGAGAADTSGNALHATYYRPARDECLPHAGFKAAALRFPPQRVLAR